ncbi:MAG: hypothetical protein P8M16_03380 [Acidimicrobiales bacterium]|nr:hypothetical protein [Acidimicrobiales bacterium]
MRTSETDSLVRNRVNGWISAINPVTRRLVGERTAYESQLIPVSQYVVVSCVEAFLRYPEAIEVITAARSPADIGSMARRLSCQANSVFLWGVANFFLIGRNVMNMVDPSLDSGPGGLARADTVLEFWAQTSMSYRGGDHLQAAEVGDRNDVLSAALVGALVAGVTPVDDQRRERVRRANATIINHLFLLYFDTRVGHGDTGPYRLEDGRTLVVRDYFRLGPSDFAWSNVATDVPFHNLTAAFVLDDGVEVSITDYGTTVSSPEDYLEHLVGFGLWTTDGVAPDGVPRPLCDDDMDRVAAACQTTQKRHYRDIVAMERDQRIACGAYVYFTFLRPFAELAGVADEIDWACPRDISEELYQLVTVEGDPPEQDPEASPFALYN